MAQETRHFDRARRLGNPRRHRRSPAGQPAGVPANNRIGELPQVPLDPQLPHCSTRLEDLLDLSGGMLRRRRRYIARSDARSGTMTSNC